MNTRKRVGLLSCAALVVCLGANVSLAGEITGNGKWIAGSEEAPLNGKSVCAYSGRQDNYAEDAGFFTSMIVQAWGQVTKIVKSILPAEAHPGVSCNPQRSAGE